jgi:hypothetical protein
MFNISVDQLFEIVDKYSIAVSMQIAGSVIHRHGDHTKMEPHTNSPVAFGTPSSVSIVPG